MGKWRHLNHISRAASDVCHVMDENGRVPCREGWEPEQRSFIPLTRCFWGPAWSGVPAWPLYLSFVFPPVHVPPSPLGFKCPEVAWNMPCQRGWIKSWLCCLLRCEPYLVKGITVQSLVSGPKLPQLSPSSFIKWLCVSATQCSHLQGECDNSTSSGAVVRVKHRITCSALGTGLDVGQVPCPGWWKSARCTGCSLCLESSSPLDSLSHSFRSLLKCTFAVRPYLAALLKTRNYLLLPCNSSSSFMFLHICIFLICLLLSVSPK